MPPQKAKKIELNQDYPCPSCRRRGTLRPIALTEALGCDRCQQIFAVEERGYRIEELSRSDPHKQRAWYWMGNRWLAANARRGKPYFPFAIGFLVLGIYLILGPQEHRIIVIVLGVLLLLLLFVKRNWV
ncbi:MAG: hypothetical protein SAJ12_09095 [Jaaginema sp. PMC 1079.18]|nr:hypothetical protein [Jaaginema sp. PMC 1080.18]MEC4851156.1 hypothetical protein [Jaaginema sp. PMC 1079.18]MEC4866701.1 hypothetical protein [Jaaginema sp. PMC 1078.18]